MAWHTCPTTRQRTIKILTVELTSSLQGPVCVLSVRGRLDHGHAKAFEAALAPFLADCTSTGRPLVLDFAQVPYISSVGLRVLLLAAKQVKVQKGRIAVAALTSVVTEVFQVSHFNMVLPVHGDVPAAVAALSAA